MKQPSISISVSVIGLGNLGAQLIKRLYKQGVNLDFVYSRRLGHCSEIADRYHAKAWINHDRFEFKSDLIILAVPDDALAEVSAKLEAPNSIIVHTSGSTPSTVLNAHARYGVFYPLQTFSTYTESNWHEIPILVDANQAEDLITLQRLAEHLAPNVHHFNDEQRGHLHLAAVLANNFTNHLFALTKGYTDKHQLPFEVLLPLMKESVQKLKYHEPKTIQSGPAKRGDQSTIQRHMTLLQEDPELQQLYNTLTQSIIAMHRK